MTHHNHTGEKQGRKTSFNPALVMLAIAFIAAVLTFILP